MIKYIKRFLAQIARFGIKSMLWVIRQFRRRNGKSRIAKESIQNEKEENKERNEPKYLTEAHKRNSEGAMKYQDSLNPSEIDWEKEKQQQKLNAHDDLPQKITVISDKENFNNKNELVRPQYLNDFHEATTKAKLAEVVEWRKSPADLNSVLENQKRLKKEAERMEREQYGSFDYTTLTKKELDELYHQIIDKALENYEYRLHVLFTWRINHEEFNHRASRSLAIRIRREDERLKKNHIIEEYLNQRWANMTPGEAKADRQWMLDQGRLQNPN